MKLIITDTETSDIRNAEIGQLTYILITEDTLQTFNDWFALDYVAPGASAVNGLTVEKLQALSCGQTFTDVAERVYNDFQDAIVVCHNVNFDLPLIYRSVEQTIGKRFRSQQNFCTMEHFTPILKLDGPYGYKWPKLGEVMDHLNISENQIATSAHKLFHADDVSFHDARFDVAATYHIICHLTNEDPVAPNYPDLIEKIKNFR